MKYILSILLCFLLLGSIFIESTIIQFPLVIIFSFLLLFLVRSYYIGVFIFVATFFFDAVSAKAFGITSSVFFISSFFYFLDIVSFDTRSYKFMVPYLCVLSIVYSVLVGYPISVLQYVCFFSAIALLFYGFESAAKSPTI